MTDARKLLSDWQTILELTDWEIELETDCDANDLPMDESDACVFFEECTKVAKIQIVAPDKRIEGVFGKFDFEETLVHELVHLKMSLLEDKNGTSLYDRIFHRTVNDIAKALVKARRS